MHQNQSVEEFLRSVQADDGVLTEEQKHSIDSDGVVVLPPRATMAAHLGKLRDQVDTLIATEGHKGGWEGKEHHYQPNKVFEGGVNRLGNLVEKIPLIAEIITDRALLAAAYRVLRSEMKIGSVLLREPLKGRGNQPIHIDWLPRNTISDPFGGVVAQFLLDDVTLSNGAMRFVPGSHTHLGWPDDHIDIHKPHPNERRIEAAAGSMIVFNLNLWHSGVENLSGNRRRCFFIDIRRRDLPQLLNQKMYLSKETRARLTPLQEYLLAIRDSDPTQVQPSFGPGDEYRARYGLNRIE